MKLIKDRHELAMAMNFGKYPVLKIDLADADDYGLKGCKVRIDAGTFSNGYPYIITATLRVYRDECKLTTSADPVGLHADFTYSDYTKMVTNAQAPLIRPDQDVVVAVYDSKNKRAFAAILVRTKSYVNKHCTTPLGFEDVDMTPYMLNAGIFPAIKEQKGDACDY